MSETVIRVTIFFGEVVVIIAILLALIGAAGLIWEHWTRRAYRATVKAESAYRKSRRMPCETCDGSGEVCIDCHKPGDRCECLSSALPSPEPCKDCHLDIDQIK